MDADLDDQEVEYERVKEGLVWKDAEKLARALHTNSKHTDGTPKLAHLYTVSELAGRYAARFFADSSLMEQRYLASVCKFAGLLHESMVAGADFETLVKHADEAVARAVADLTPDCRMPRSARYELFVNRIGLAEPHTQLVALADMQHTVAALATWPISTNAEMRQLRTRIDELQPVLASLGKLESSHVIAKPVQQARAALRSLDQTCRKPRK